MNGAKRIKITDLNPHLICVLCGGYFIDATTLTECPHSFCKKCIIKYLETSKHCPVCDVMVHKTRPHMNIRSDKTLQDLVYKLVPGLYKNEMKRRREYYRQNPHAAPKKVGEDRGDEMAERIIYTEDENFSLALHFCSEGVKDERTVRNLTLPEVGASSKEAPKNVRYLQSPAGVTIGILKKFIRLKYELLSRFQIDIFHTDEALHDDLTVMDIAYIYTWRRKEPLRLNYTVYECAVKKMRLDLEPKREKSSGMKGALKEEYRPQVKNHTQVSVKQTYKQSSKQMTGQVSKSKQVAEPTGKQCTVVPSKQGTIPAQATTKPEMKQAVKEETKSELKLNGKGCSKQVEKEIKKVNKKAITKQQTKPIAKEEIRPPTKKPCKVNGILQGGSTVSNKTSTGLILSSTKKMAGGAKPKKSTSGVKILQSLAPQMTTTTTTTTTNSRTQTNTPSNGIIQEPSSQTSTLNTFTSSEIPVACATLPKENNSGTKCSSTDKDQKAGVTLMMEAGASSASDGTSASRTTAQQQQLMLSNVSLITSAASSASSFTSTTATTASTVQAADPGAAKPSPSPMVSETKAEEGDAKVTSASLPPVPNRQLTPTTTIMALTSVTTVNNINTGTSSEADAAGAAGASDAVQAPAALAASSSPSPPMGSTASSVKEQSLTSSSLPTQTSLPLNTSTKPLPVSAASARPSSANPSLPLAPKATVVSQKSRVHDFNIVSKTITTGTYPSSCSAPLSSGLSGRSDEVSGESPSKAKSASVVLENLNSHGSSLPVVAASSSPKTIANKTSIDDSNDINTISSSSRVPVGSPTVISTVNSVKGSSGRVCNGMPPVVTRMMRVSNASTSVNTLPKTYQTNAGQQTRPSSRTPVAIQPAVAVVTASSTLPTPLSLPMTTLHTPLPVVPMTTSHTSMPVVPMTTSHTSVPIVPTTHSLVRTSAGSAIAVAMAKRASELQHLKLQQQQQQMYEQQRLHLLQQQQQQHHLMNIQAAAVRWTAQQVTAPVSRIPASPTSSSALVGSSSPKMASSPRAETPAAKSPDAESPKRAGSGELQQAMLNKKSADMSSKKKISDIANSLHKKVSQTCNNQKRSDSPSVLKRPPNAHSANNNNKRLESGPEQGHARSKGAIVCDSGMDRQDEPLNLVTRDNKDSPRSSTGLVQVSITG